MKTHHTDQAQQVQNTTLFSELPLLFQVLKNIVLERNPNAKQAELKDLHKTLHFFKLTKQQADISDYTYKRTASQAEFSALMRLPKSARKITLNSKIKPIVAKLLATGELTLRYPNIMAGEKVKQIYDLVYQAAASIPAQQQAASLIAADLAAQLSNPKPTATARILIQGKHAWGNHEMLQAISATLYKQMGYSVLELDCSAYRSEGESASWTGSKRYWSGSAPGEITAFIHRHPKAVVCFYNMDETLPSVMSVLRSALSHGVLIDQHGLESAQQNEMHKSNKQQPTEVDCKQALFLCSISHASHWMTHPQAETILGNNTAQQKSNLISEVHQATREYRGEQVPLFDATVLQHLQNHHHLIKPISWQDLYQQCLAAMPQALRYAKEQLGLHIEVKDKNLEALTSLNLLHHGAQMGLIHTTPQGIYRTLIDPIFTQRLRDADAPHAAHIVLRIGDAECEALHDILLELGDTPLASLYRKNQFVNFAFVWEKNTVWVQQVALQTIYRLSDYTKTSGLISQVPKETLQQVAGQDKPKTFLREVAHYLRNPKILKKYNVQIPRGVVLHGAPGTGKTLLARALAGEAGLPFISVTASEMLNAEFMTQVYQTAHRCEPCIIHIDEADALGKRGQHSHAHDVAVNLLLAKIDGFEQHTEIFHVLTTNRPDNLDSALTRPGRIDHSFEIMPLDIEGRTQFLQTLWPLLETNAQNNAVRKRIVKQCFGMTGAELKKLRREVALRLSRQSHTQHAPIQWVMEEINRIQYGETHESHIDAKFCQRIAVHEVGHAVLHHLLFPAVPIAQLSITPRSEAAGFLALNNEAAPKIEQTPSVIRAHITTLLGGRAAEIMMFGAEGPSAGASDDLARATEAAFKAVAFAGLDAEFGNISLAGLPVNGQFPSNLHDAVINRVKHWVGSASKEALITLKKQRSAFQALLSVLLEKETLDGNEVAHILNTHITIAKG